MPSIDDTKNILTKDDLIIFLKKLHDDFELNQNEWGNDDLGSFLEALAAYLEDIDGFFKNIDQTVDSNEASWRIFADLLAGARIYE